MEESKVWKQRNNARDLIAKALESLDPGTAVAHNEEICNGDDYHLKLTRLQISRGVQAFVTLNTMSAGSDPGFDLFRLLEKYILDLDARREINKILAVRT